MARKKYFPIFFLLFYLLFIFYITLYSRSFSLTQSCNLDFFWSYAAWAQGKSGHGREILLNIALFVPLGYFLAAVLDGSTVRRFGLMAAGLSLIVSVAIEGIQYVDGLGLAEWDDVFNNVLGACLGIGVYTLLMRCCREESLPWWKLGLSVLFLLAGVAGCRMVHMAPPSALVFHLYTDEPGRLPEPRKKYGFDNRGFRAGDKNEITRTMRSGKYRVFVRVIWQNCNAGQVFPVADLLFNCPFDIIRDS